MEQYLADPDVWDANIIPQPFLRSWLNASVYLLALETPETWSSAQHTRDHK